MTASLRELAPILIRASAGTGKTFRLSQRFLTLLLLGEKPEKILATTFTRKAAGEIQNRVFYRLASAILDPSEAENLLNGSPRLRKTSPRLNDALRTLVRSQHRLNICTLDSFFVTIAGSFALELGLPQGWSISEDHENARVVQDAIRSLCCSNIKGELLELLRLLSNGSFRREVHGQIEADVQKLHQVFQETDLPAWDWLRVPEPLNEEELSALIRQIPLLKIPETKNGQPHKSWEKGLARLAELAADRNWRALLDEEFAARIREGGSYCKVALSQELRGHLLPLIAHAAAVELRALKQRTLATRHILRRYHEEYLRLRAQNRRLSFDDIKLKLASSSVVGDLEELYFRLDSTIAHVLLDEFQDTALPQWQVLQPIADEILSKPSDENTFFCVGDVKQAIYSWRGGVAEIFNTLQERWPHIEVEPMSESRRSAPEVISLVNDVFSNIGTNPALSEWPDASQEWGARFDTHRTVKKDDQGYVKLEVVRPESPEEDRAEAVLRRAANLIAELQRRYPEASIGVLVRKNESVSDLIFKLSALGIRASGEGGGRLTDSPAVNAVLSLLCMIDHPGDRVARFHVAGTPLGAVLDYQDFDSDAAAYELAQKLRSHILRDGLAKVIAGWTDLLLPHTGRRDQARLSELPQLAQGFGGLRLLDFVEQARMVRLEESCDGQVRVMTVHKAKGLEFKIVVLPELDEPIFGHREELLTYRTNPASPPEKVSRSAPARILELSPELSMMQRQNMAACLKEALSLLYVAITRSEQSVYMLVQERKVSTGSPTFSSTLKYSRYCRRSYWRDGCVVRPSRGCRYRFFRHRRSRPCLA